MASITITYADGGVKYIEIDTTLAPSAVDALISPVYSPLTLDKMVALRIATKSLIQSIPDWATWKQSDWATWYAANIGNTQITAITNLTDAKVVLSKMSNVIDKLAKMVLALRDNNWPDL